MLIYNPNFDMVKYNTTDKEFRDSCCSTGIAMYCNKYFNRRVINRGTGYLPPVLGEFTISFL